MTLKFTPEQKFAMWALLLGVLQQAAAMITALGTVGALLFWLLSPRLEAWVLRVSEENGMGQYVDQITENTEALDQIRQELASASATLKRIEAGSRGVSEAPLEFLERGNDISHGHPGSKVVFTWYFRKLHDCGAPIISAFFRDTKGYIHRFKNLSLVNDRGEGVNYDVDPDKVQVITYAGYLPDNNAVNEGVAHGWVNLRYELCPVAPEVRSPEVRFQILGHTNRVMSRVLGQGGGNLPN